MDVSADQIRAARAMLHLPQDEVARRAGVSVVTVRRIEAGGQAGQVTGAIAATVRAVLEQAGIEFIPGGVRRRRTAEERAALLQELKAISLAGAARLRSRTILTDDDLYDENGLPK